MSAFASFEQFADAIALVVDAQARKGRDYPDRNDYGDACASSSRDFLLLEMRWDGVTKDDIDTLIVTAILDRTMAFKDDRSARPIRPTALMAIHKTLADAIRMARSTWFAHEV